MSDCSCFICYLYFFISYTYYYMSLRDLFYLRLKSSAYLYKFAAFVSAYCDPRIIYEYLFFMSLSSYSKAYFYNLAEFSAFDNSSICLLFSYNSFCISLADWVGWFFLIKSSKSSSFILSFLFSFSNCYFSNMILFICNLVSCAFYFSLMNLP